jgi:hypothetical protein
MGDLLAYYLQNAYLGLQYQPWNEAEMAIINRPLPKPMVPDNYESSSSKCHQGESLIQIVQDKMVPARQATNLQRYSDTDLHRVLNGSTKAGLPEDTNLAT